ncbi:hypothetical protein GGR56DRAFT_661263 [Xylariaceae sp. FL0804]|nr:hypothetical protein GGR56DRAFT_661263 [Xylariaceae sp. FL0804]
MHENTEDYVCNQPTAKGDSLTFCTQTCFTRALYSLAKLGTTPLNQGALEPFDCNTNEFVKYIAIKMEVERAMRKHRKLLAVCLLRPLPFRWHRPPFSYYPPLSIPSCLNRNLRSYRRVTPLRLGTRTGCFCVYPGGVCLSSGVCSWPADPSSSQRNCHAPCTPSSRIRSNTRSTWACFSRSWHRTGSMGAAIAMNGAGPSCWQVRARARRTFPPRWLSWACRPCCLPWTCGRSSAKRSDSMTLARRSCT